MFRWLFRSHPVGVDAAILLLRFSSSLWLMYYGWDKYVRFQEKSVSWPDPFHIGSPASLSLTIFAELICPVFILTGLFTRLALIPAIFNMIMAILIGHAGQPFTTREHAFSFLIPFLVIFLLGPGKFSADRLISK
jgi:putative oxidoreductase